jgi:polyhydroxybutyrate depolymerase
MGGSKPQHGVAYGHAARVAAAFAVVVALQGGPGCAPASDDESSGAASDGASEDGATTTSAGPASGSTEALTDEADGSAGSLGDSTTSDPTGDTGTPVVDGCGDTTLAPGIYNNLEMEVDGEERVFDLIIPESYDPDTPTPLVVNFHGFTSNPQQQVFFSVIEPVAQAHGFIVALPFGVMNSWNGGACCGDAMDTDRDDVGFSRALVAEVSARLCIDDTRVYAMGMSNGGFMSHRLACEAADLFAAIGPVAGVLGIPPESCTPSRPVPVMHIHGTEDPLVAYEGNAAIGYPPVVETMEGWAERNGCEGAPEVTFEQDDVRCETWPGCDADAEVTLCTVEGAGHCWPGQELCPYGTSTTTINASEELALFFEQHSLP